MRYFIVKDKDGSVTEKHVVSGGDADIPSKAEEVELAEFDDTPVVVKPSKVQTDWQAAKAQGLVAAVDFIASVLKLQ